MKTRSALGLLVAIFAISACNQQTEIAHPEENATKGLESHSSNRFLAAMDSGDYEKGVSILQEVAGRPNAPAMVPYNLGLAYERGQGVKQNFHEAANWYLKAAQKGNSDGQYNLAVLYANGNGVSKNMSEAAKWYREAAAQGYTNAQFNLGLLYFQGMGVRESKELAYMWWVLAAASEDGVTRGAAERNRQIVSSRMTAKEISQAKNLIKRCKASNYTSCG